MKTPLLTHSEIQSFATASRGWGTTLYQHYVQREGRSTRWQFVVTLLLLLLVLFFSSVAVFAFLSSMATEQNAAGMALLMVLGLGLVFQRPFQAVYTKRLHDLNRTGWLFFAAYLTVYLNIYLVGSTVMAPDSLNVLQNGTVLFSCLLALGYILSLTLLLAGKRGSEGSNYYGSDPLARQNGL